jgi:hypothetical protein
MKTINNMTNLDKKEIPTFKEFLESDEWGLWIKDVEVFDVIHNGDCTRNAWPCLLCNFEQALETYREKYLKRTKDGS